MLIGIGNEVDIYMCFHPAVPLKVDFLKHACHDKKEAALVCRLTENLLFSYPNPEETDNV
jgi:hypothetical protein